MLHHPDQSLQQPHERILRRAALRPRWVPKLPPGDRPAAYRALLSLLASSDAALQLAAISSFQACLSVRTGSLYAGQPPSMCTLMLCCLRRSSHPALAAVPISFRTVPAADNSRVAAVGPSSSYSTPPSQDVLQAVSTTPATRLCALTSAVTADCGWVAQAMVDDWEFSEAQFTEFVSTTFTLLAAFMGASEEYDSQLQVGAGSTFALYAGHHFDPAVKS